jgi:uncharacterized membrane protein
LAQQFSSLVETEAPRLILSAPATGTWITWAMVAAFALSIVAAVIAAPLAMAGGHPSFAGSIYNAFSYVCHQRPERSFHIAGYQFAVCARCTGLYSGFAIATLFYPRVRSLKNTDTPALIWLLLSAIPIAIDFGLGYFGIWENTFLTRFVSGALLSGTTVFYILPGLVQLSRKIFPNRTSQG